MNILLIGGMGSLINQLIKKMKKEGHRVHLLTGNRYKLGTYEKVFERYDLPYDSECLTDVFDSVNPDVTIFMGAFDSNFRWSNEQREMVRFTSGLTNFLTAHAMSGKGRFIFLSSDCVYSENYTKDIVEDTETSPADMKGMALAQGEEICQTFKRLRDADIVVLRLDNLYKIPRELADVDDICSNMCLEAMKTGRIFAGDNISLSLLFESDAVQFIYQMSRCEEHQHDIYNLSSGRELTERQIAEYIQQAMGEYGNGEAKAAIVEKEDKDRRCVLSNRRFDNEFGVRIFADDQKNITDMVKYMTAHENIFIAGEHAEKSLWQRISEKAGWLFKALFPYLENLIFFLLFFLLNSLASGSQFFSRLDFYLLYVLLFAVVHGQQQATFSAIFSVIGYFITEMMDRTLLTVALDYNVYVWIAQLFIVGLVVGYMKDQISKLRMETEEERQYLGTQLSDIKDINSSNVRVKDALETQIINQNDSIGKIYTLTSTLEQNAPEEVLFHAAELLRDYIGSKDIAIYTVSNRDYARLFTFTSDKAKVLGKSIRYRELSDVYNELANRKVFINRTLDERYPMMATAIFDGDDMQTIIMAWGIPWERMTLGQADMLMVVSYLIQNAVLRASKYLTMLENRRYQEGKLFMEQETFAPLVRVFLDARQKHLTECVVLRIIIPDELPKSVSLSGVTMIPGFISHTEETEQFETTWSEEVSDEDAAPNKRVRWSERSERPDGLRKALVELWSKKGRTIADNLRALLFLRFDKESNVIVDDENDNAGGVNISGSESHSSSHTSSQFFAGVAVAGTPSADSPEAGRYEEVARALAGKIRNTDYIGVLEDGDMYVLLCNTNNDDAEYAMNRIKSSGFGCVIVEDFGI